MSFKLDVGLGTVYYSSEVKSEQDNSLQMVSLGELYNTS